jgi:hypothetical protein
MKPDEDELMEKEDDEEGEMQKAGSDSDFVKERLQDESGGIAAYRQALESVQDPKLKEILQAIQEDEQKHNAALEQWLREHDPDALEEHEGEESPEEETAEDDEEAEGEVEAGMDDEPEPDKDDGKGELIDQIREVLAQHDESMKKEDDEPEEEELPDEEPTEKADEDEDEKPDFLKDDEEEEPGKITKSFRVPIMKSDRQIVYGIVSEPGVIDLQGDRLSESEIRKACHSFMQTSQQINKEHEGPAKADIIESYIAPTDFSCNGQKVRKGSWVLGVKVHDPGIWQAIKKGEITGFSIAGQGERTPF